MRLVEESQVLSLISSSTSPLQDSMPAPQLLKLKVREAVDQLMKRKKEAKISTTNTIMEATKLLTPAMSTLVISTRKVAIWTKRKKRMTMLGPFVHLTVAANKLLIITRCTCSSI